MWCGNAAGQMLPLMVYIEPKISKVDGLLVVLHTQPLNLGGLIQISSIRGLKMLCAICKHGSSRWSESTI